MSTSMSGVSLSQECIDKFEGMKLKHNARYLMFKIKDQKTIIYDSEAPITASFDDFVKSLPSNEPRYAVVDVDYTTKSKQPHNKIVFVFWSPDGGAVKEKMIYASSKDSIKKGMPGIQLEVQANDLDDLVKSEIQTKLAMA